MLTEAGSLQGEFIMLQLLDKKTRAQIRRISELTKAYGDKWLGPLHPKLVKRGRAFSRGFLSKCELKSMSKKELEKALALPELRTVSSLNLSGSKLSDLQWLAGLTELEELEILIAPVTDLGPLSVLTKLRSLDLRGTQVDDLSPLSVAA